MNAPSDGEPAIRRFFDAAARGDWDAVDSALAEDVVLVFPGRRFGGRFEGRRKVAVFLRQNQRLFEEGLRFELGWIGAAADRVVVQWTNSGRTRTGVDYANRGATVFVLRDGRIAEIHDYLDTETLSETWPR